MATLIGSLALSESRLARLKKRIPGATGVIALWVHHINLLAAPTPELLSNLEKLLCYGNKPRLGHGKSDNYSAELVRSAKVAATDGTPVPDSYINVYHVVPRTGTISPWSSQATAIARVCGLGNSVRRIERGIVFAIAFDTLQKDELPEWRDILYDRMTEELSLQKPDSGRIFSDSPPGSARTIDIISPDGTLSKEPLLQFNRQHGLALDQAEIDYLMDAYGKGLKRNPTDVELFMFGQINSEHCRHKVFNASWTIDGMTMPHSLFGMIRHTHHENPEFTVSAYSDNAAVFQGVQSASFMPNNSTGEWLPKKEIVHYIGKVETHNHPTAIAPFPGAATGSGGEIRDEGAVGRGSQPKAGMSGFIVSDLMIPEHRQPWELDIGRPGHVASALDIMLEAPIGSSSFNNEFGRPCTTGFFRTFLSDVPISEKKSEVRGYHKPIMIAGGVGTVRPMLALKEKGLVKPGDHLVALGGPAMLIGLGGGAASSVQSGASSAELDFASVQRANPEMQRRVQEVINVCCALGSQSPIKSIHDVGAGGYSNAFPELVADCGLGADMEIREIDNADMGMSPLQIWCNEAQERYVCVIAEERLNEFLKLVKRERCGYSVVGKAIAKKQLTLRDRDSEDFPAPIDVPMDLLFAKAPKMSRIVASRKVKLPSFDTTLSPYFSAESDKDLLREAVRRVLSLPAVGSKSFLITIGDRTVGGLTARDQMVGPWQVPVADVSVTATALSQGVQTGEAMAAGERPIVALVDPAASARMAVAESLMNLAAAEIMDSLSRVRLSANWMSSSHDGEPAKLYEAVQAIAMDLCPRLGVSIPVGKDSLSMKMKWTEAETGKEKEVTSPLSLIVTAFACVRKITNTWTPALRRHEEVGETLIMFVDLAEGAKAMGGSALAQVFGQVGNEVPDIRDIDLFKDFFDAIEQLHESGIVLAYHDRSDGGLFTTLVEMAFAGRTGVSVMLDDLCKTSNVQDVIETLFNEELGAVFQIRKKDETAFKRCFATCGPPPGLIKRIANVPPAARQNITFYHGLDLIYSEPRAKLQQIWAGTSYHMQRLRDEPSTVEEEFENIIDDQDPGLQFRLTFDPKENIMPFTSMISRAFTTKPRVAILREQGTNGHAEMAFAFHAAGFAAIDVHMTDLISGRVSLASCVGLAACGGFSYGDVLSAGRGWAMSVLFNEELLKQFQTFFERKDTFTLGVCNGCQFLARLKSIIPGAEDWPTFETNRSEQYEARVCMVEISEPSSSTLPASVFFHGMNGSQFPIVTAHAEGRATFNAAPSQTSSIQAKAPAEPKALVEEGLVPLRYLDNRLRVTERYPFNPNGSPLGIAGVRTPNGRVLAMMPHPERTILSGVGSYIPDGKTEEWGPLSPWHRMFKSARRWVG